MDYITETIGGKDYKFRLTIEKACELEDDLGKNPLSIFLAGMPKINDLRKVFIYAGGSDEALQKWIDEGRTIKDLTALVMNVFKVSGFIEKDDGEKNA